MLLSHLKILQVAKNHKRGTAKILLNNIINGISEYPSSYVTVYLNELQFSSFS